ncbi:MAG: hypothetical protein K2X29_10660 [Candidatus Obscuribacterales bacterium]|nr:hypothetical protein [Candidatus Obscuribacterales bacterium]
MNKRLINWPRKGGQSIIELCAGLIVLVPIIMALVDLAFVIASMQVNDAACRDAARAAAAGPPTEAFQRASGVAAASYRGGGYIKGPTIGSSDVTTNPASIPDPGPFGGPYQGTVRVKSHVELTMPVPIPFVAATMNKIDFVAQQEFPITYVKPNTATIP